MEGTYKFVDGTAFHPDTPDKVCDILSRAIKYRQNGGDERLRLYYGDAATGVCWMDEFETIGYIGRSTGRDKIPLLIKSKRSLGGPAILDHCVVRIDSVTRHTTLYTHPEFHFKEVSVSGGKVFVGGDLYAEFTNKEKARRLADFLLGKRHTTSGRN